jgi:Peptidase family M48
VERESLLCVLIVLLGGLALQCSAIWSKREESACDSRELERLRWFALWRPVVAAMFVAAALVGWATSQPDPVPDHVGPLVFVIGAPFALIFLRAAFRASWSLLRPAGDYSIATVGIIRPRVVVSHELARSLDEQALEAALAHERAHVRNRDPLRIWIGQFAADMQWPWACGERRFAAWLEALEQVRDDDARAEGVDGAALAAAVLGSLRFQTQGRGVEARLTGDAAGLQARIARLLKPLSGKPSKQGPSPLTVAGTLTLGYALAVALGAAFGESLIRPLLAFTS